jgi:hypothetical protein
MATDDPQKITERLEALEKQVSRLSKSLQVASSSGSLEVFDQETPLYEVAGRLEVLIELLEQSHPGIGQQVDLLYTERQTDISPDIGEDLDDVFEGVEEGSPLRRQQ